VTTTHTRATGRIPLAATLAVGASAGVLFALEPFAGKVLLPRLGGSPSVWNTCVMVFQILLLAGYGYSVLLVRTADVRRAVGFHTALVAASILAWPVAVRALWMDPRPGWPPVAWVAVTTLAGIGLPFALLSATSPLLQVWLARTAPAPLNVHKLYAASNIASAVGLVAYVGMLEPFIGVSRQSVVLGLGYAAAMILALVVARRASASTASAAPTDPERALETHESPTPEIGGSRAAWIAISFGASLCLYAVNTYIATDVASFPLLWCFPLGVFLLGFAAGFSAWAARARVWLIRGAQLAVLAALAQIVWVEDSRTVWIELLTPILALGALVTALAAELAHRRPPESRLAGYYTWIGLGGVLAGVTSVVVLPWAWSSFSVSGVPIVTKLRPALRSLSPLLLTETVPEYAAALLLSSWILSSGKSMRTAWRFALSVAIAMCIAVVGVRYVFSDGSTNQQWGVVGFAVACAAIGASQGMRLAAASLTLAMVGGLASLPDTETIFQARNFFGTSRVQREIDGAHRLKHGTTLHGLQPAGTDAANPASYYSKASPLGHVMERIGPRHVLVVGLGVGTVAAYGRAGDRYLFLEINPLVLNIATNPQWFTYVEDARRRGVKLDIEVGDGRLLAQALDDGAWDLIVVDAFSSDAIPSHLLSVEAVQLFQHKLSARGILAFHISNRFFDLRPILAAAATRVGMPWAEQTSEGPTSSDFESTWVMLAANDASAHDAGLDGSDWQRPPTPAQVTPWTDDWANVLGTMKSWRFWKTEEE
jgi:spermidine synthase